MRRWAVDGVLTGLGLYAVLLTIHLAKFRTIAYSVPNIAGWAGSYPGYGWTWELTAINMPADLIDRSPRLRNRGARPQVVTGHGVRFPESRSWSATGWVVSGVAGYALAGVVLGSFAWGVRSLGRSWARRSARRRRFSPGPE